MEEKKRRPRVTKNPNEQDPDSFEQKYDNSADSNETSNFGTGNDYAQPERERYSNDNNDWAPRRDFNQDRTGGYERRDYNQGGGGYERRPYQDRNQQGGGYERRPYQDRNQQGGGGGYERRPYQDRNQQGGGGGYERRPYQDRNQQGGGGGYERRPYQDRNQQGGGGGYERRPYQDRNQQGGGGGYERRPYQDRSQQGGGGGYERRPYQDRSQQGGGGGYERRPYQDRSQQGGGGGYERRPYQDRSQQGGGGGYERRPYQDRSQQGGGGGYERRPYQDRSQQGGGGGYERRPYQDRGQGGGFNRGGGGGFNRGGGGGFNRGGGGFKNKFPRQPAEYIVEKLPKPDLPSGVGMPLNKYLAHCGITSRRKAVELIEAGEVQVNGLVVHEPYYRILEGDVVNYNGQQIIVQERSVYILLNKPKGIITTTEDDQGRATVLDIVDPYYPERIYPVGRLDRETTGLLLITNDGDLAQKLSHPSFAIAKQYRIGLDRSLAQEDHDLILSGIELEDGPVNVNWIRFAQDHPLNDVIELEITSGRNRIVRRIFEALGYNVNRLDRFYYAGLTKKNLPRGSFRDLTQREIIMLKYFTGSPGGEAYVPDAPNEEEDNYEGNDYENPELDAQDESGDDE